MAALAMLLLGATASVAQGPDSSGFLEVEDLNRVLAAHESAASADRKALDELLATPEVRALAESRGFDPDEVAASAETLSDQEVSAVAPLLERAAEALRQNQTITISVYTVIIVLLLLILVT